MTNCPCDVGLSVRCFRLQSSKIDVSTFGDRCVDLRRSMIDVSTFEDMCDNFRRSMCRPSDIDVSTFRRSMINVPTYEDRWSMSRLAFEDRCVDLRRSMIYVKLCCYTCSKHLYYSCMRIATRVCTSVLSLTLGVHAQQGLL